MSSNMSSPVQRTPTDDVFVSQPRPGKILEVAVDLRRRLAGFRKWGALRILGENKRMIWVRAGLARGFRVASESALVFYKTPDQYSLEFERILAWSDPDLKIDGAYRDPTLFGQKPAWGGSAGGRDL